MIVHVALHTNWGQMMVPVIAKHISMWYTIVRVQQALVGYHASGVMPEVFNTDLYTHDPILPVLPAVGSH